MTTVHAPPDSYLLVPHHQTIADGAHLVLRWEPSPGAERYRVQIARDADFKDIVLEHGLPADVTALVVRQHFPEDDQTFYWRALAGNAQGWSEGERIESFISGSAEQVGRFADPDEAECFGPVAALFSAATLETAAETTPGRQPGIEQALGEEHPEGVEAAEVLNVGFGLVLAASVVVAVVLFLFYSAC